MQGGIYNAALFGASQREARGKLDQMAGIKRPSGILASSPQLMQAAAPAMTPRQPMPMPQPMMQPAPVPMVQPALPQIPMQTAVAPMASVQQPVRQAPAPRPMAQPQAPRPAAPGPAPIRMQEGGPVDVSRAPMAGMGGASPQMIKEASKEFIDYARSAGDWMVEALVSTYGGANVAEKVARDKAAKVQAAAETKDQGAIVDASMDALELPNTDAAKQDVARTVFGMEDVNDIDEINRRIADVAVGATLGKSPDAFAQAVMLGLNNYKQTAAARAAAAGGSGGQKMSPLEPFPDAVRDLAGKIMAATGGGDAAAAIRQAQEALAPYYSGDTPTMSAPGGGSQNLRQQLEEALKLEPERREEILKQATDMGVNTEGL